MSKWIVIDADVIPNIYTATHQELIFALEDSLGASTELIRCGECKWFDSKGHCMRLTAEYGTYEDVRTDDFCSYGSRSEKPNNLERSSE